MCLNAAQSKLLHKKLPFLSHLISTENGQTCQICLGFQCHYTCTHRAWVIMTSNGRNTVENICQDSCFLSENCWLFGPEGRWVFPVNNSWMSLMGNTNPAEGYCLYTIRSRLTCNQTLLHNRDRVCENSGFFNNNDSFRKQISTFQIFVLFSS